MEMLRLANYFSSRSFVTFIFIIWEIVLSFFYFKKMHSDDAVI